MYAIVDIETTGSHPAANGITEIAIVLHNGSYVEERFETLINPGVPVPQFVTYLTGIHDAMLQNAPTFEEVALHIHRLLGNRIFVAHNVNFDYTFIKYHLQLYGLQWQPKKLCTLKLSRMVFPGYTRYGLGHICRALEIIVENRHRAGGDANATAILFERILQTGGENVIKEFLKRDHHEQILPPNLSRADITKLPYTPGVYFFHDSAGKIIYVGKAKNVRKRVLSHFTGLNGSQKRQEFLRNIHKITFKECPTELTAFILESIEIKKHWPIYNLSQKRLDLVYAIYFFEDAKGYYRLAIDKKRKHACTLAEFHLMNDAYRTMWQIVKDFDLHPYLCHLHKKPEAEINLPEPAMYNARVMLAVSRLQKSDGTFLVSERSVYGKKHSCILIENGKFYGMGLIPDHVQIQKPEEVKPYLTCFPENEVIPVLIKSYVRKNPQHLIKFKTALD